MRILGIDTSTRKEGIALAEDGRVVAERNGTATGTHSERLLGGIGSLLERAGLEVADLDGFAVAAGPGSFTGIRIGLATVQGLALACRRPAVAISTLELMAHRAAESWDGWIAAWIDAGRGEVFAGTFRAAGGSIVEARGESVGPPGAALRGVPAADPAFFLGDGVERFEEAIRRLRGAAAAADRIEPGHPWLGAAAARLGGGRLPVSAGVRLRPNYIRRPDAERNRCDG